MKQHFTVGNKYYGNSDRKMSVTHAQAHVPYSYAFCCNRCGEVWARCGVEHPESRWQFMSKPCPSHSEGLDVSGSLWIVWDREFNESLPHELLQRELEIHLTLWESLWAG